MVRQEIRSKRLPEEKREAVLPALFLAEREEIRRLTTHREGTAGAVMTSDYARLPQQLTFSQAIEIITQQYTEEMEKFMAITGSHEDAVYMKTQAWVHFKNRSPL